MVVKGGWWWEKALRGVRTVYFVAVMVASLLVVGLPLVVAVTDAVWPCLLISSFTCVKCYGFQEHLRRYSFRSSLIDIPLVSIIRSLVICCTYIVSDGQTLPSGPYLGTVTFSSIASILLLSFKSFVFTVNSQLEDAASVSLSRKRLHLKRSWGMPVLFLSSVVFALGHIVVAYRTSYKARRKLILQRVDPEAALPFKMVFSSFQKVPRSPTPLVGKSFRFDSETRRKATRLIMQSERELPVSLIADKDSLFFFCRGLKVHYKLSRPGSFSNQSSPSINSHLHYSTSTIYTPLLGSQPSNPTSEDAPIFSSSEYYKEDGASKMGRETGPRPMEWGSKGNEQFGIVLVHGFGGGVFSWRNVMGPLAEQMGCTVVAFDRPGWGFTSRPRKKDWEENELNNPYKIDNQVDLLVSFCTEVGFSSVVLVGHDDGGLLVLKAAQKVLLSAKPIKLEINGIVLMNVSLSRELVPAFARILLRTSLGKKHLVRPLLRMEITQLVNRRAWYDETKLSNEVLGLYKAPLHVEGWDEALHEIGKLSCETVSSPQDAAFVLKAVENLPVLFIAGAEDALVPVKSVQAMASKLVNSRLVAIGGCGHLPHEECPRALVEAILPFITRVLRKSEIARPLRDI